MKPKKVPVKEAKDGEVQKLKRRIKRLETENRKLKSELNAYDQAFRKTKDFLIDSQDEFSVEETIQAAKSAKSLRVMQKRVKITCRKCLSVDVTESTFNLGKMVICKNTECGYVEIRKGNEETEDSEEG